MNIDYRNLASDVIDFLVESNGIEGVYDDVSLQQAIYAWEFLVKQKALTVGVILKTHKILMLHQHLLPNEKGYFRTIDVYIGGCMGLAPASIHYAVDQWVDVVKQCIASKSIYDPYTARTLCESHHIRYEQIHPFVDGNGRTGRMFLNYERLKLGLPILVIREDEKDEYYRWFN